jgi:hypothetical protein
MLGHQKYFNPRLMHTRHINAKDRETTVDSAGRPSCLKPVFAVTRCGLLRLFLILLLLFPAAVQAQFVYATNNGTITITGYTGPGGTVIIPDTIGGFPVTGIGDFAFSSQDSLTNVIIPKGVTSIGFHSFSYCFSLTSVTNPESITSIADLAFAHCTSLTNVAIPTNTTSVGALAFYLCTSLTSINIPNSVTNVGYGAFAGCHILNAITVESLNPAYSSLDGIWFNKSQTTLIQCPETKRGSITIPQSVTGIERYAFSSCTGLTAVTIQVGVSAMGQGAFKRCDLLTNIYIPRTVTNIGSEARFGCTNLGRISVDPLNPIYSSVDGVLFDKNLTWLIQFPGGKGGSYTIPASVSSIESYAFSGGRLTDITIGNNISAIQDWAFASCGDLTNVTIANSVTSLGYGAFYSCTKLSRIFAQGNAPTIGGTAFYDVTNAIVYYLPGTTGWGPTLGDLSTAWWHLPNPLILDSGPSFGVKTNRFGFIISWATNATVVVEATTNLANPTWSSVGTNTLTGGSSYFSDSQWANHPARFYRLRSP